MNQVNDLDAKQALEMINEGTSRMHTAEKREDGNYLILWGVIYGLVPLLIMMAPAQTALIANGIVGFGVLFTIVLARKNPVRSTLDAKVRVFWFLAFLFAIAWVIILAGKHFPSLVVKLDGRQTWAFGVTIAMMLFTLMGLLYRNHLLLILGLAVSALTVFAFLNSWAWSNFWPWMAVCAGGPLLGSGLWCKFPKDIQG